MDVVGRARRGQPVDKPVTRSVRYRDREHDQHREMLARGKEFDGDNDKLLVEYQQDIDIGNESELPKLDQQLGDFNQELKDMRRVLRRESLRTWLPIQMCLQQSPQGAGWSMDSSVFTRGTRMLRKRSGKSAKSRQPRL